MTWTVSLRRSQFGAIVETLRANSALWHSMVKPVADKASLRYPSDILRIGVWTDWAVWLMSPVKRKSCLRTILLLLLGHWSVLFAADAQAQVTVPISTAVTNDWQITTWNNPPEPALAVIATPDFISVTSTRNWEGVPYSAGWLNTSPAFGPWNGVWTATYRKINIPAGAGNIKLTITALDADDRVVLYLNDVPVPQASFVFGNNSGPGILNTGMFGQGNNISINYPGLRLPSVVTTGFIKGGDNVIKAVINNTFSAEPSAPSRNLAAVGDGTAFRISAELSYDVTIAAIEVTQAVQEYQALADLKQLLANTREPPVPIVALKPAVIRIYTSEIGEVSSYKIQLSGAVNETKSFTAQPGCKPKDQREQARGCNSVDFYFSPSPGPWDLQVRLLKSDDTVVETHNLPLKSRSARTIILKSVGVCDDFNPSRAPQWLCPAASDLASNLTSSYDLLSKIAPTDSIKIEPASTNIFHNYGTPQRYQLPPGAEYYDVWEYNVLRELQGLYSVFDDVLGFTKTNYIGMFRANVPANRYSSAAGLTFGVTLNSGPTGPNPSLLFLHDLSAPQNGQTLAHEVGHEFGLNHTGVTLPALYCSPSSGVAWPYPDNYIQEVGFDVAARKPKLSTDSFDIMGYCKPERNWISPFNYKKMLVALDRGASKAPSTLSNSRVRLLTRGAEPLARAPKYWTVSGSIVGSIALLDPLFDDAEPTLSGLGMGTHRIELRGADGAVVGARSFTPIASTMTTQVALAGPFPFTFSEVMPVTDGTVRIVVIGPTGLLLGSIDRNGTAPAVSLNPVPPQSGVQTISWASQASPGTAPVSRLYYSSNAGADWAAVGEVTGANALSVNFDLLPGGTASKFKVSVSDGALIGSAESVVFTVPRKAPSQVAILSPRAGDVIPRHALVRLAAFAQDAEDGSLDGSSIKWQSSISGALGTGAVLNLYDLQPGTQLITMTAIDSDGNAASASLPITIASAAPVLNMAVTGINGRPVKCVRVSISATLSSAGVELASLGYSLDGARTWTLVSPRSPSFQFTVPTIGEVHLVARAVDVAGQAALKSAKFTVNAACDTSGTPRIEASVARAINFFGNVVQVLLNIKNVGDGVAADTAVTSLRLQILSGTGTVSVYRLTPPLPIRVPPLGVGQFAQLLIYLDVPSTVTRFSLSEDLLVHDTNNVAIRFSLGQRIITPPTEQ